MQTHIRIQSTPNKCHLPNKRPRPRHTSYRGMRTPYKVEAIHDGQHTTTNIDKSWHDNGEASHMRIGNDVCQNQSLRCCAHPSSTIPRIVPTIWPRLAGRRKTRSACVSGGNPCLHSIAQIDPEPMSPYFGCPHLDFAISSTLTSNARGKPLGRGSAKNSFAQLTPCGVLLKSSTKLTAPVTVMAKFAK